VGHPGRTGEIVEVRGAGGEPPYLVRFDDGHTALVFPGPDATIEHPRKKGKKGPARSQPRVPQRACPGRVTRRACPGTGAAGSRDADARRQSVGMKT
jgi:hypothetical protein